MKTILRVNKLNIAFAAGSRRLPVVNDFCLEVGAGEIVALVGESGCGKSISCLALTGLLPAPPAMVSAESIEFFDKDSGAMMRLDRLDKRALRKVRGGRIAYIFQEPSVSLNPVFRVGDQVAEVLELHDRECRDVRGRVIELFRQVGIPAPEERIEAFPHELSGGMQQRVMIAMALAGKPELLIADEPTTALDVTIQSQILELIRELAASRNMGVVLVTHNLGIVSHYADRVQVMYAGMGVERAAVGELLAHPAHPYTAALLGAVPRLGGVEESLSTIPGQVPEPWAFPAGCRFAPRCAVCAAESEEFRRRCFGQVPPETELGAGHFAACYKLCAEAGGREGEKSR